MNNIILSAAGFVYRGKVGCGPCGNKKDKWVMVGTPEVVILIKGSYFYKKQHGIQVTYHISKLQDVINELQKLV